MTTRVPVSPCPHCGKANDAMSSFEGDYVPEPGSVAICMECGNLVVMDESMHMRLPTDAELVELAGNPEVIRTTFWAGAARAYREATEADIEACRDAIDKLGPRQPTTAAIAEQLGRPWDIAKVFGVMSRAAEQGHAVMAGIAPPSGMLPPGMAYR